MPHGLDLLLMARETRPGHRWSGDMAFPGGLREPGDRPFGRLPEVFTVRPRGLKPMGITPWLFELPRGQEPLAASREVEEVLWAPLGVLTDPSRRTRWWKRLGPVRVPFPAVEVQGRRVWGLTLQMIDLL